MRSALVGDVYLDASSAIKLYVPEADSDAVEAVVRGRTDLVISNLTITEITSALTRRRREGRVSARMVKKVYQLLTEHVRLGHYRVVEVDAESHREAERLLLTIQDVPLRSADALHLAAAALSGARLLICHDQRLRLAAHSIALATFPE